MRFLRNIMGMWIIQECRRQWEEEGQTLDYPEIVRLAEGANDSGAVIDVNAECFFSPGKMADKVRDSVLQNQGIVLGTVGEIARCVYASMAKAYRGAFDELKKITGREYTQLQILGGGSKNAYLNDMIGRELGVDVWNLGFGGGAFLEPELAEWIVSRRDWKFAVLELGANLFHLPPEEFRKKVRKFLTFFAADSERRRVFILDLLPNTGEIRGAELEKAAAFRRVVREETASADAAANGGKGLLLHLEYASLLPDVTGYSTDLLHPAAHAFETIGRGLAAQIRERLLAAGENLR